MLFVQSYSETAHKDDTSLMSLFQEISRLKFFKTIWTENEAINYRIKNIAGLK